MSLSIGTAMVSKYKGRTLLTKKRKKGTKKRTKRGTKKGTK